MSQSGTPTWTVTPQPGYQINSTAISADGGTCLLGTSEERSTGEFAVFCYDGNGKERWSDSLGKQAYQGVFWVALSADGAYAAAGGRISESDGGAGFLRAYRADDGSCLLDERLLHRMNEVALSADGSVLAAVSGDSLRVYVLQDDAYRHVSEHRHHGQYCQSCAMSADGSRIVVGTKIDQEATRTATGLVTVFERQADDTWACTSRYASESGIEYVAVVADGSWWAVSRQDGKAVAFHKDLLAELGRPAWTYAPEDLDLSSAYGIAIAKRDDEVYVICGANVEDDGDGDGDGNGGCLYAVKSRPLQTILPLYKPEWMWTQTIQYGVNPGVNTDLRGQYVTATDGQPEGGTQESPGNFYLFDVGSGEQLWQYPTSLMNWPMVISAQGNAAFGASDNGSAYYWDLTASVAAGAP